MSHPTTTILTRRALLRAAGGSLGLAGVALLEACGRATPTPQASAPPAAQAATATTVASTVPVGSASSVPSAAANVPPSAPSSIAPSAAASAAAGTGTLPPVDDIPQGRTSEGFPVLGAMDAKVTLTDYSDFL